MEKVDYIIFRKMTDADFFHINKPAGTETGGGGQSYIDIPTSAVTKNQWQTFFNEPPNGKTSAGPKWDIEVNSLGTNKKQEITISQRRENTFSIRAQKISSRDSNRVYAWHPEHTNFPVPSDPKKKEHIYDLVIYLVALKNG
jgi:hypothetical protein